MRHRLVAIVDREQSLVSSLGVLYRVGLVHRRKQSRKTYDGLSAKGIDWASAPLAGEADR